MRCGEIRHCMPKVPVSTSDLDNFGSFGIKKNPYDKI